MEGIPIRSFAKWLVDNGVKHEYSLNAVYTWVYSGKLRAVRGIKILIPYDAANEFLASMQEQHKLRPVSPHKLG